MPTSSSVKIANTSKIKTNKRQIIRKSSLLIELNIVHIAGGVLPFISICPFVTSLNIKKMNPCIVRVSAWLMLCPVIDAKIPTATVTAATHIVFDAYHFFESAI
jgi:hypothetical protein